MEWRKEQGMWRLRHGNWDAVICREGCYGWRWYLYGSDSPRICSSDSYSTASKAKHECIKVLRKERLRVRELHKEAEICQEAECVQGLSEIQELYESTEKTIPDKRSWDATEADWRREGVRATDAFSWNLGRLSSAVFEVDKGSKPVAEVYVRTELVPDLMEVARRQQSEVFFYSVELAGYTSIYVYKHKHLLGVIKEMRKLPEGEFHQWAVGKLYGYSEQEIADWIERWRANTTKVKL